MSLADITNTIIAEAKAEAENIQAGAKAKAAAAEKVWAEKAKGREAEIIGRAQSKADQKVLQSQFKLQAHAAAEILKEKKKVIDEVYKAAYRRLGELPEKDYVELMARLLAQIKASDGNLISAAGKESLLKKALQKTGQQFKVANETVKDSGGFIFRSPIMEINDTFSKLVDNSRDQTMLEVTSAIFKQD